VKFRISPEGVIFMTTKEKQTTSYFTVKEMPEDERPRERMAHVGPQALSTPELLAIILRTGMKTS
jgi:hypothetical protein